MLGEKDQKEGSPKMTRRTAASRKNSRGRKEGRGEVTLTIVVRGKETKSLWGTNTEIGINRAESAAVSP